MSIFTVVSSTSINCEITDFIDALDVWCIKPQVANRRLAGSTKICEKEFSVPHVVENCLPDDSNILKDTEKINNLEFSYKNCILKNICDTVTEYLPDLKMDINEFASLNNESGYNEACSKEILQTFNGENVQKSSDLIFNILKCFSNESNVQSYDQQLKFVLRKLLPRNGERYAATYELVFILSSGVASVKALFIPLGIENNISPLISKSYCMDFNGRDSKINYSVHKDFDQDILTKALVASKQWLSDTLFIKLKTWSEASFFSNCPLRKSQALSLINIEEYAQLYSKLKKKYGPYFIQIWPESTDPLKFVYEDIGIATYLLLLWADDRKQKGLNKKQSFIDLGCGNGLLVHILMQEGHPGKGIDLTRRKIWDLYDESTILEIKTVLPNELVVEEDWIIGNHSDELTPWIPIIAARSSFVTNYFALPCCFHDFYSKFHRVNQKKPQYETYLDYISGIGEDCGFVVEHDALRIPSSKKICQVGKVRSYPKEAYCEIETVLSTVITSRCHTQRGIQEQFQPREVINDPRNCSRVDKKVQEEIINTISEYLLSNVKSNETNIDSNCERLTTTEESWVTWNCGGCMHLNELVGLFAKETLQQLKTQCGGIQTLLKNNRNIFKVVAGMVSLRDYRNSDDMKRSKKALMNKKDHDVSQSKRKTKLCWFYMSHPHGCVLTSDECKFAHGGKDLNYTADMT